VRVSDYVTYTSLVRSYRELWLWLGAAFLALFAAFIAIGLAYYTKEVDFSFYTSWEAWASVAAFILGFTCFACAITGIHFPPWAKGKFPNINVEIYRFSTQHAANDGVLTHSVRITNLETEQNASLTINPFLKLVDSTGHIEEVPGKVRRPPLDRNLQLDQIRMPITLTPGTVAEGDLVYKIPAIDLMQLETMTPPLRVRYGILDHPSGKQRDITVDVQPGNSRDYRNIGRDAMVPNTPGSLPSQLSSPMRGAPAGRLAVSRHHHVAVLRDVARSGPHQREIYLKAHHMARNSRCTGSTARTTAAC
jgi:hypothetical protein